MCVNRNSGCVKIFYNFNTPYGDISPQRHNLNFEVLKLPKFLSSISANSLWMSP